MCYTDCTGNYTQEVTNDGRSIQSPLYPEYYPPMQTCTWLVTAPQNHSIGFKFIDFDLGPKDYIELKSLNNESTVQLQTINRTRRLNSWRITNGKNLWVKFVSHQDFTYKGFQIEIKFLRKKIKGKEVTLPVVQSLLKVIKLSIACTVFFSIHPLGRGLYRRSGAIQDS